MAAAGNQRIRAMVDGLHQGHAGNGTAGALPHAAFVKGDDEGRLVVPPHQLGGYNAHHAGMPRAGTQHNDVVPLRVKGVMKHFHRIRPDGLLFLLPLAVVGIQHLGKLHGPPGIHGQQEFQRIHGGIHAPGGIDARAYPEPHVGGVQEARVVDGVGRSDARYFRQGFEARMAAVRQPAQAVANQNPVFRHQGNNVRHGCHGHQVQIKFQVKGFQFPLLQEGMRQLEDYARAAQISIWAVFLNFGIDHRRCIRTPQRARLMVVQNDDVYPQAVKHVHLLHGGSAAVHRNKQTGRVRTFAKAALDAGLAESVAFPGTDGNKILGIQVISHQNGPEKRHGGDTVHIIVPINAHGFPFIHGPENAVHGSPHFPHQERVAQVGEPGVQKEFRFHSPGEAALQQELLDQQGQFRRKRFQDRIILLHGRA